MRLNSGMHFRNRVQRYYKKMKNTNYSLKKHLTYSVLLLLAVLSGTVRAEDTHFIGGSISVGEWSLLPLQKGGGANIYYTPSANTDYILTSPAPVKYKPSVGASGSLVFQYELQYKPHSYSPVALLFDAGIGASAGWTSYLQSTNMMDYIHDPQIDINGNEFTFMYAVTGRRDQYMNVALQIPLMIGLQYNHFYGLAGVKFYYNMLTKNISKGTLSTYGKYPDLIGDPIGSGELHNMPEYQFFENVEMDVSSVTTRDIAKGSADIDIDASLELGYRIGMMTRETGYDVPKRKREFRIGVFADFGIFDWHKAGHASAIVGADTKTYDANAAFNPYKADGSIGDNRSMVEGVQLTDIMQTSAFADKLVHSLQVGIKFTFLFELPKPGQCVICRDSYQSMYKSSGGSRKGMKYEEE